LPVLDRFVRTATGAKLGIRPKNGDCPAGSRIEALTATASVGAFERTADPKTETDSFLNYGFHLYTEGYYPWPIEDFTEKPLPDNANTLTHIYQHIKPNRADFA
jgi:hypothetical protein